MKIILLSLLMVAAIGGMAAYLLGIGKPELPVFEPESIADSEVDNPVALGDGIELEEDAGRAEMREGYARLEQTRSDLGKRLSRLKHESWGVELGREQAVRAKAAMMEASQLQRDGRRLAGFRDAQHIESEISRLRYALGRLDEVDAWVKEARRSAEPEQPAIGVP